MTYRQGTAGRVAREAGRPDRGTGRGCVWAKMWARPPDRRARTRPTPRRRGDDSPSRTRARIPSRRPGSRAGSKARPRSDDTRTRVCRARRAARRAGRSAVEGDREAARVRRVDRDGLHVHVPPAGVGRVVRGVHGVPVVAPAVVRGVLSGCGPHERPAPALVCAAPEGRVRGVDHRGVCGVEGEGRDHSRQVEESPGEAPVRSDVGAGHVAAEDGETGIVGADGRSPHRPAAAGAQNLPGVQAGSRPRRWVTRPG